MNTMDPDAARVYAAAHAVRLRIRRGLRSTFCVQGVLLWPPGRGGTLRCPSRSPLFFRVCKHDSVEAAWQTNTACIAQRRGARLRGAFPAACIRQPLQEPPDNTAHAAYRAQRTARRWSTAHSSTPARQTCMQAAATGFPQPRSCMDDAACVHSRRRGLESRSQGKRVLDSAVMAKLWAGRRYGHCTRMIRFLLPQFQDMLCVERSRGEACVLV